MEGAAATIVAQDGSEIIDSGDSSDEERLIEMEALKSDAEIPKSSLWSLGDSSLVSLALWSMVAGGIQFGWALQLSLLTPYVQTLGIGHSSSSFIWLCGPVTGLIVQPCVGIWSDRCRSKWGRRRPFIFVGALLVCVAVVFIGFAADFGYLLGDPHVDCKSPKIVTRPWAVGIFVLGFWMLDVANNTVQAPARALLADLAGPTQRNSANAIFCSWIALGNILGFATGAGGHWHRWFPFLKSKACYEACGNLKAAYLLAVIFLAFCTAMTLWFSHEVPLLPKDERKEDYAPISREDRSGKELELTVINGSRADDGLSNGHHNINGNHDKNAAKEEKVDVVAGPGAVLVNLLVGMRQLPEAMKSVLVVMTLSWLSWFPFFLFDTDWMGREVYNGDPSGGIDKAKSYQKGVQAGAFGLLLNSVVLGVSSFLIDPLCRWLGSKTLWATSNFIVFICMASTAIISASAYHHFQDFHSIKNGALVLFAVLGFPLAVTYSVPFSITAELTADTGGGQGLAMGILNLSVVIPQLVVALGAGPWDAVFGGGNEPAFVLAALFALVAGIIAIAWLPQLSREGYHRTELHGLG
ncbi:sucrose transport protein SUT4 isoform X1 [Selaginella moellendorffii]|nr:sucrose transport protein SUT4 isoform X1 [Selaginella moellendorffii]|eukprot:XP_002983014.2 sucrose transport protein SUT4 isoform X1 [Selaginella moellendorffii]